MNAFTSQNLTECNWTEVDTPANLAEYAAQVDGDLYPLAVKANIAVRGFRQSAGCKAFDQKAEDADAPIVAALRASGAVVIGTNNMHELAFGITSNNASFGPVLLPGHPEHLAGGSSGGSAACVATGETVAALGTDTGGSISIPAAHCGVVGFRPTTGRWPTAGVIELSWTRDTTGIFTRDVDYAAALDQVVTGEPNSLSAEPARPRLGIPKEFLLGLSQAVHRTFHTALKRLETSYDLIPFDFNAVLRHTHSAGMPVVLWEAPRLLAAAAADKFGLQPREAYARLTASVASADVRGYLQSTIDQPVSARQYEAAQRDVQRARLEYGEYLTKHKLDALLFPTTPTTAPRVEDADYSRHGGQIVDTFSLYTRHTEQGSVLGVPMLTLPLPVSDGELPVGLTLQGPRFADRKILRLGSRIFPDLDDSETARRQMKPQDANPPTTSCLSDASPTGG